MCDEKQHQEKEFEYAAQEHERLNAFVAYANQSAIDNSTHTLKALLLINGGAAVAMLGMLGAIASGEAEWGDELRPFLEGLIMFALGVAAATLSSGMSYIVMYLQAVHADSLAQLWEHPYVRNTPATLKIRRWMIAAHIGAVALAVGSLGCFLSGVWELSQALTVVG